MGVTGLWKLIEPCGKPVPVETLEGKVLAVDISIWLHQVVKGFQDSKGSALPNAHLLGLFNRLCKLLYFRVKPVFVFDGSVPQLKRDTIARRQQQRSKLNTEAERIQALLLQSLAKEKVVQQALGANAELLLKSPQKRLTRKTNDADDMFKLPELPAATTSSSINQQNEEDSSDYNDSSFTSWTANDNNASASTDDGSSFDESTARHSYNANLQAIDVKSQHFRNLPADVRHEILVDIKETRKQSSWGRLHELPSRGDDFSVFQMKRLLKRRAVQESLEEAEQQMGGRTLTYAELNNLFTEEGILEPAALEKGTKPICSDEHTRFLLVRDLKKKLSKTEEITTAEIKKQDSGIDIKDENSTESLENKLEKTENEEVQKEKLGKEFNTDLELALAMSLADTTQVYSQSDYQYETNEQLKLNRNQRKRLQNAAIGPARAYMIEYGGMNEEEVENIMEKTQVANDFEDEQQNNFDLDLEYKNLSQLVNEVKENKPVDANESESEEIRLHVSEDSSETSDFEEVMDDSIEQETSKKPETIPIEIVVDPAESLAKDDDLFADVFVPETESQSIDLTAASNNEVAAIVIESQDSLNTQSESQNIITISDSQDNNAVCKPKPELEKVEVENSPEHLLLKLKTQLDDIKNINLNDIKVDSNIVEVSDDELNDYVPKNPIKEEVIEICDSDDALPKNAIISKSPKLKTPTKSHSILEYYQADYVIKRTPEKTPETDVPKVTSPFFINKTPKSGQKHSPASAKKSASKATKSLFENESKEDEINDALGVEPIKPINTEELINEAAEILKEKNTEEELKAIAADLAKQRQNLESERNRQDRMGMPISQRMSLECQELLRLFGVPYIVAPMEAEAQCAFLDSIELTNGTITDDSDIWLFGGRTVYKNFFAQNKHVLEFRAEKIQDSFNCDRKKLIQLACLVGSDYTTGINGIGAVTALEILASFASNTSPTKTNENMRELMNTVLGTLTKFRDWWLAHRTSVAPAGSSARLSLFKKLKNIELHEGFPSLAVVEAYLTPKVDDSRDAFCWGSPDVESIREYAKKTFGWTDMKTNEILNPVLKRLNEKKTQATIRNYFAIKSATSTSQIKVSKRVQKAIDRMSGKIDEETPEKPKATKKRKVSNKKKQLNGEDNGEEMLVIDNVDNKEETENVENCVAMSVEQQPSTSQQTARVTRKRAAPNLHSKKSDIIPQREKDKAKMLENKKKAAEILKQQTEKLTAAKKKKKQ